MGRYINLCSSSVDKTWRSYCKIRRLILNNCPHLAKAPICLDHHKYSLLSPPCPSRLPRKSAFLNFNNSDISCPYSYLRGFSRVINVQIVRFYSSSNRNAIKAEAPIGIFEESQNSFQSGGRLGQSFNRLSKHINLYFKKKDIVPLTESASLVFATSEYTGRSQSCSQCQLEATGRKISEDKDTTQTLKYKDKEESSGMTVKENTELQLFHVSSFATRFGETYSYVADHINSVFFQSFAKLQGQENMGIMSSTKGASRKQRRGQVQSKSIVNAKKDETSPVNSDACQTTVDGNTSNSWEEGYLHFARHINKYFGVKVTDKVGHEKTESLPMDETSKKAFATQSASQAQDGMSKYKPVNPVTGLFHSSHNTTTFGENYFRMSSHINQYFKGPSGLDEGIDRDHQITVVSGTERQRTVSFMECLRQPLSAIPDRLGSYLKVGTIPQTKKPKPALTSAEAVLNKKLVLSRRKAEEVVHALIYRLGQTSSPEALTTCVEALNEHLIRYPSCKTLLWQEKTAVALLRRRRTFRDHQALQSAIRETLALIGYVDPVKGWGIRVLSIDGGGTRGVVPLQVLKLLEAETGKKVYQLFDYICGVSTGAVLAFMLGLAHFSLEECADMYRRFGSEVFRQNRLVGTMKMGWSHSYYNTETWEAILQEKLGDRVLIKTARDELCPKVSAVSAVVNWGTSPKAFVFCNYNHKPGCLSRYAGGSGYQMWQAVRASSAAPGYFQEFLLQSDIHQDGGIIMNNPCALAVHESRLLWPNQPFQCVVSLGTGRYDNARRGPATPTSLRAKISSLISSATDTEGVHTLLDDLLAPDVYFRFNPMLSAEVSLDESRPRALDQLQRDTKVYLERNRLKLARLCLVLGAERSAFSRTTDWMSERAWEVKQRWV
ncbi:calcium-independent phospholipase A2-gamma-like [Aulostomus maculatus]